MRTLIAALFIVFMNMADGFAQNPFSIKGTIRDTATTNPLQNTSVVILNAKDSTLVGFTRAGESGSFAIPGLRAGDFILLVSYPDYADYTEKFSLTDAKPVMNFGGVKLILKARLLEEVIVQGKMAQITIKGDTTEFNADAFNIEANSKVEDLLKQLPGIQVDQNGKITAQGETVSKVLVDGEEFFGDDPTLVTKNIRGDMVDKVQLFDKKSDQATFTGIDDGERTKTLNIKLKEDKKQGYFGKVVAGAGNDEYYDSQLMFNAFKGKQKFSAYGTLGNTGKTGLSWEDNSKYGTSSAMVMDGGMIMFSSSGGDELDSYDGRFNGEGIPYTQSGGLHYDSKWKEDKYTLNMNYKVGSINVKGSNSALNQNNLPTGIINSNTGQNFDKYMFRHKLDAMLQVKLDTTSELKFTIDGTLKNSENTSNFLSNSARGTGTALNSGSRLLTNEADQSIFNASALWNKKLRKTGRTISLSLAQNFNEEDADGFLNSENSFFNLQGTLDSIQNIDQYKTNFTKVSAFNSNIAYTEPLSKTLSVIVNYGLNLSSSIADRNSFNQSIPGRYDIIDAQFSNNYELDQTINQVGAIVNYKKAKNVINFGTRVSAVDFSQKDVNTNINYDRKFTNWQPQASFQHNFSRQKSISLRYNGYTTQPSISQIQPIRLNNDPLNITLGNADLVPSFQNRLNFNYNSYKVLSDKSIFANGGINMTSNAIVSSITTDEAGKSTYRSVNMTDKQPFNFYGYVGYRQKVPGTILNMGFQMSTSASTYYNYINDALNETRSNNYSPSLNMSIYKPKKIEFYFNIGPSYMQSQSSLQKQTNNNGWAVNSWLEFTVHLPGKVQLTSNGQYMFQEKTQSFSTDFDRLIWNTTVTKSFMKDESLKFSLTGNDLFNQNVGFNRYATSNIIRQNSYTTIQRYFLMSLSYDLNHMGGGAPKK